MSLEDVLCQERAVKTLRRAFAAGRVPHAYIFAGAEGVGKFKTAREWARLLLCSNPATDDGAADSCGSCESCRLFDTRVEFGKADAAAFVDDRHALRRARRVIADEARQIDHREAPGRLV